MVLPDVNILLHAMRIDAPDHERYRQWVQRTAGTEGLALPDVVTAGVLRISTNRRIFSEPTELREAFRFVDALLAQPRSVRLSPGPEHWAVFRALCLEARAEGNLLPDAYLAALAVEHGCELVSNDGDFARFRALRWRRPFD